MGRLGLGGRVKLGPVAIGVCGRELVFLLFFGRLVGRSGVKRGGDVRCVGVYHWNVRDLVCCHVMVWHSWVRYPAFARQGYWSSSIKLPVFFGVGLLVKLGSWRELLGEFVQFQLQIPPGRLGLVGRLAVSLISCVWG